MCFLRWKLNDRLLNNIIQEDNLVSKMPKAHNPRRGSLQFWPRKRAKHSLARVRSWTKEQKVKPLGFIGYKAGMTHLIITDNRPKSPTKGEQIMIPSTIIDCPPVKVIGLCFYSNKIKVDSILAEKLDKKLKIQIPKKTKPFNQVKNFDDLRLLVSSGTKIMEIALGGTKEEKLSYGQQVLGKEIKITDVFEAGTQVDVRGITKGKGFQGTVKRYGVPIRQHKAEKTKRGIGNLGAWTPKRVQFTVAQPGKMGFHLRTEYNKQLVKISDDGKEVTPKGGLIKYGLVRNTYCLIKGSVAGSKKRALLLTPALRPDPKIVRDAPEVEHISK